MHFYIQSYSQEIVWYKIKIYIEDRVQTRTLIFIFGSSFQQQKLKDLWFQSHREQLEIDARFFVRDIIGIIHGNAKYKNERTSFAPNPKNSKGVQPAASVDRVLLKAYAFQNHFKVGFTIQNLLKTISN